MTAATPIVTTQVKILFGWERSTLVKQSGHSAANCIMLKKLRLEAKDTKKNKKPRPFMIGGLENLYFKRAEQMGCEVY